MSKNQLKIELLLEDLFFDKLPEKSPISEEIWQNWFEKWFNSLNPAIPYSDDYEVSLRLTDDAEIKSLNSQFRSQDKATDVLSFPSLEVNTPIPDDIEELYLGDIIVSVETAKRQAQQQRHSLKKELAWLAVHGFLHLLGWDHPDDQSLTEMLNQQKILLKDCW